MGSGFGFSWLLYGSELRAVHILCFVGPRACHGVAHMKFHEALLVAIIRHSSNESPPLNIKISKLQNRPDDGMISGTSLSWSRGDAGKIKLRLKLTEISEDSANELNFRLRIYDGG